jgi:quinol monooxygenase YgiN
MITLTGHITVPPERMDDIRAALPEHIRLTRLEPGCISFDVVEDPTRPGVFTVAEKFTDEAAFRAHQKRGGKSDWARVSAGIPRDYTITGLAQNS